MLRVKNLMKSPVITVGPAESALVVAELMDRHRIRHLPVVEDSELIGLVSKSDLDRQILGAVEELPYGRQRDYLDSFTANDVMTRNVVSVDQEQDIPDAATTMMDHKFGCLPVTEGTRILGILTESDFVRFVAENSATSA